MSEEKHILLVDDEKDILLMCGMYLNSAGYKVTTAENSEEALSHLKEDSTIGLVISDINIPGKYDGLELLSIIVKDFPDKPPVIITTGFTEVEVKTIYEQGANGFMTKPYIMTDFVELIESLFSK